MIFEPFSRIQYFKQLERGSGKREALKQFN